MKHRRVPIAVGAVATSMAIAAVVVSPARADNGTDTTALREAVTVDGILVHENALQDIADANGGTRAAGTPGYEASGAYVEDLLEAAGYNVSRQEFTYDQFNVTTSALEQTAPVPTVYEDEGDDADFAVMTYSGSDDVTAPVQAVDINLAGDRASTSGCEAADFAGFTAGNIALIQRGTCTFRVKVDNAAAAGAAAVIVFNQGNVVPGDDRLGLLFGTLDPPEAAIPAVGTTFELGEELATTPGLEMRVAVEATLTEITTFNVLADTPGGRADRTVIVGAHLDSVPKDRASTTTAAARRRSWRRRCRWPSSASSRPTGCASRSGAARRTDSSARTTTSPSSPPVSSRSTP